MKKALSLLILCFATSLLFGAGSKHCQNPQRNTIYGSVYAGYQGWFRCPGDSFIKNGKAPWIAWAKGYNEFKDGSCCFDIWPSMKEYKKTYPCAFTNADGTVAEVYSSADYSTVNLHFKWMKDYGIDGAIVQRFPKGTNGRKDIQAVTEYTVKAAKENKVGIYLMYDFTGMQAVPCADKLIADWKMLVDKVGLTRGEDCPYLFHNGKPVVILWGLGFSDRHFIYETTDIAKFFDFLKNDEKYGNCYIIMGVPTYFRLLEGDCIRDKKVHEMIIKYANAVSPWNVGRYRRDRDGTISNHQRQTLDDYAEADIEWCAENNIEYLPVIHPGFSWYNGHKTPENNVKFNEIPREKGKFFWDMAASAVNAGSKMLFIAMFDEVNEATAIFKCTNTPPVTTMSKFLDMESMPEDYYLTLAGKMKDMLKAKKALPQPKAISSK